MPMIAMPLGQVPADVFTVDVLARCNRRNGCETKLSRQDNDREGDRHVSLARDGLGHAGCDN